MLKNAFDLNQQFRNDNYTIITLFIVYEIRKKLENEKEVIKRFTSGIKVAKYSILYDTYLHCDMSKFSIFNA